MKMFLESFDKQFLKLHERAVKFTEIVTPEILFAQPRKTTNGLPVYSCGEYLLRSAGAIEQTFGGITTKLWDDPFEWTLPEYLSTPERIGEYLQEVEKTRRQGFSFFKSDEDLHKKIPAPTEIRSLFEILLETIARAEHFQGRSLAMFQLFSDEKLPKF